MAQGPGEEREEQLIRRDEQNEQRATRVGSVLHGIVRNMMSNSHSAVAVRIAITETAGPELEDRTRLNNTIDKLLSTDPAVTRAGHDELVTYFRDLKQI